MVLRSWREKERSSSEFRGTKLIVLSLRLAGLQLSNFKYRSKQTEKKGERERGSHDSTSICKLNMSHTIPYKNMSVSVQDEKVKT